MSANAIAAVGLAMGTAGGAAIAKAYNLSIGNSRDRIMVPSDLRYMLVPPDLVPAVVTS
jgi:hypothetical protein